MLRRRLGSGARLFGLAGVALCLSASGAGAAPMTETEPNDDALRANGPIPADGFTSVINVADDKDYFTLQLKGRRQVKVTLTGLNTMWCRVVLRDGDGSEVMDRSSRNSEVSSATWTTPRDAVKYTGVLTPNGNGFGGSCNVKAEPADAVITAPLVAPDYLRTLDVTAPSTSQRDSEYTVTATGNSADDEKVVAKFVAGGCPTGPEGSMVEGPLQLAGPFSQSLKLTTPSDRGVATLCVWLYDTLKKLQPLVRQQPVTIQGECVVPSIARGTKLADVVAALAAVSCSKGKVRYARSRTYAKGTLIKLSPAAGTALAPGAPVDVVISSGRPCVVPSARAGVSLRQAQGRLRAANCAPGIVRRVKSRRARGTLVSYSPSSGSTLAPGTRVTIKISRGRR